MRCRICWWILAVWRASNLKSENSSPHSLQRFFSWPWTRSIEWQRSKASVGIWKTYLHVQVKLLFPFECFMAFGTGEFRWAPMFRLMELQLFVISAQLAAFSTAQFTFFFGMIVNHVGNQRWLLGELPVALFASVERFGLFHLSETQHPSVSIPSVFHWWIKWLFYLVLFYHVED